jgi:SAM-dependent methyltransferase
MTDALDEHYRAPPYPPLVHPFTHPAALAAVARLFGLDTPDPVRGRVLELGTGRGANLVWIAGSLPKARCTGVDLMPEAIADARRTAKEHGARNATFVVADVCEHDLGGERFDYIIAHGLLSWTPENVQQRVLDICRDHLAERGVAMISYNALPGSATRDALRRLMLLEMDESGGARTEDRLAAADRVAGFFETALPGVEALPHGPLLRAQIEALRKRDKGVLVHDDAGVIFEPFYLLQFTQWAAETGLGYVVDADMRLDWMDIYPKPLRHAIVGAAEPMPRLKALQYADFAMNVGFRQSLVCRAADAGAVVHRPKPDVAADLWVREGDFTREPMTGRPREVPVKGIGNTCGRAVARALLDHPAGSARLADLRPRVAELMQEIDGGDAPDASAVDRAVLIAACVGTVVLSAIEPTCA